MLRARQIEAFRFLKKQALKGFGGVVTARSHPMGKRPFSPKAGLHIILRSSRARGEYSMLRSARRLEAVIQEELKRVGGRLYDLANAGNHLHLVVRIPRIEALRAFLRAASGRLARLVLGAKKGTQVLKAGERFWDARPWSRLVAWGPDYRSLKRYLLLNRAESRTGLDRLTTRAWLSRLEELAALSFELDSAEKRGLATGPPTPRLA